MTSAYNRRASLAAERLRTAFELHDVGVRMQRQRFRRVHPSASEAEIDDLLRAWSISRFLLRTMTRQSLSLPESLVARFIGRRYRLRAAIEQDATGAARHGAAHVAWSGDLPAALTALVAASA